MYTVKCVQVKKGNAKSCKRSGLEDERGGGVGGVDGGVEKSSSPYPTACCLSSLRGVSGTQ